MSDQDLGFEVGGGFASDQLIQAREALGLGAEAIQRELRLTSRVVVALESGDLAGMGQPVFARGYIRSYCKRVGIDAEPFVAQYDAIIGEAAPKRSKARDLPSGAASAPASMTLSKRPSKLPRILGGVVKVLVVVGILGGAAYGVSKLDINLGGFNLSGLFGDSEPEQEADPNRLVIPGTSSASQAPVVPTVEADAEPTAVAEEPSVESVIETVAEEPAVEVSTEIAPEVQTEVVTSLETPAAPDPQPESAEQVTAPEPAVAPEPLPAPEVVAQVEEQAAQPDAEGVARVTIEFSDVSWVNIKDAKGEALFNGLAEKGRKLELSGPAPVNFVIGRADAVSTLTFNGTTVDLEAFTRKNVARLTLPR